eukprot:GEMP01065373.1.p1 GENE.GEMP01065373.1~~GEMP01065373.1.p1  ORF type:complete len:266 (+),score=60.92 GEMP01065373.1:34-831(+)
MQLLNKQNSKQALRKRLTTLGVPWSISMSKNELVLRLSVEAKRREGGGIEKGCGFLDDLRKPLPQKGAHWSDVAVQTSVVGSKDSSERLHSNGVAQNRPAMRSMSPTARPSLAARPPTPAKKRDTDEGRTNGKTRTAERAASGPPSERLHDERREAINATRRALIVKLKANPLYAVHGFPINLGVPFNRVARSTYKVFNIECQDRRTEFEMLQQPLNRSIAALQLSQKAQTFSTTGQMSPDLTFCMLWKAREAELRAMEARGFDG